MKGEKWNNLKFALSAKDSWSTILIFGNIHAKNVDMKNFQRLRLMRTKVAADYTTVWKRKKYKE